MSTRGLFGFVVDGQRKVSYNHYDSYPEGLGNDVVKVIRTIVEANALKKLCEKVVALQMINRGDKPTDEQITQYSKFADTGVSTGKLNEWYVLMRKLQGANIIMPIFDGEVSHMVDSADFFNDSLFCEWAYFINLDTNKLEVYKGIYDEGKTLLIKEYPLIDIPATWIDEVSEIVNRYYPE